MPKQGVAGRKVMIVFEEDGTVEAGPQGGMKFRFYLDGITPSRMTEINKMTNRERCSELSPAEFYATEMFSVVAEAMKEAGVVRSVTRRS